MSLKNRFKSLLLKYPKLFYMLQDWYISLNGLGYCLFNKWHKVEDKQLLFMSFFGKNINDNPKALLLALFRDRSYKDYHAVVVLDDLKKAKALEQYSIPKNRIKFVLYRSNEFFNAMATSKYIISNVRVRNEISLKHNQVYLQTWHGTPLKKLGFDIEVEDYHDIGGDLQRLCNNYLNDAKKYTYLLSPSPYYSKCIASAFGLDRLHKESCIIELGYPRNDFLYSYTDNDVERVKRSLNIPEDKKVILYAPTFRENELTNGVYGFKLKLDLDMMKQYFGDEAIILLRLHYYVSQRLNISDYKGFAYDVSDYNDINELYIISNILITDYSSVFFDYAILNRPIIHFMYDLEEYNSSMHDFYISTKELPGVIALNNSTLCQDILDIMHNNKSVDYTSFNEKFNPYKGAVAGKILQYLFL